MQPLAARRDIVLVIVAGLVFGYLAASLPLSSILNGEESSETNNRIEENLSEINDQITFEEGFYGEEDRGRWMAEKAELNISSNGGSRLLKLNITMSNGERTINVNQDGETVYNKSVSPDILDEERASGEETLIPLELTEGYNIIELTSENGCSQPPNPKETRCLSVAIGNSSVLLPEN